MIRNIYLLIILITLNGKINGQLSFEHQLGISGTRNTNIVEIYRTEGLKNVELLDRDLRDRYSIGAVYYVDAKINQLFVRSGVTYNSHKLKFSAAKNYKSIGLPIYLGYRLGNIKLFSGVTNRFNIYTYGEIAGFQVTKENCFCTLDKFHQIWQVGLEYQFWDRVNLGFTYNILPRELKLTEGVSRIDKTKFSQLHLTFQF